MEIWLRLVQGRITARPANFDSLVQAERRMRGIRITQLLQVGGAELREGQAGSQYTTVPRSNSGLEPQTFYNDGI